MMVLDVNVQEGLSSKARVWSPVKWIKMPRESVYCWVKHRVRGAGRDWKTSGLQTFVRCPLGPLDWTRYRG